jgi:hypothetical protein
LQGIEREPDRVKVGPEPLEYQNTRSPAQSVHQTWQIHGCCNKRPQRSHFTDRISIENCGSDPLRLSMAVTPLRAFALTLPPRPTIPQVSSAPRSSRRGNTQRRVDSIAFPTYPKNEIGFHRMIGLSSARLHSLWSSWAQFSRSSRTLGEQFKFIELFPDFMPQFITLTKHFTQFNKFSIVTFNSIHADCDLHAQLNGSAVWQSANSVMRDWNGFIQQLNEVTDLGTQRFFPILSAAIDQTMDSILELANLYFVGCIISNVTPEALTEIRGQLHDLRLLVSSPTSDSNLDLHQFSESIQLITTQVNETFLAVSPRFTFSSGELIQDKLQVKIALKELVEISSGLVQFEEATRAVKQLAFQFNDELMDIVRSLQLPWRVTLTSPNGRDIMVDGIVTEEKPAFLRLPKVRGGSRSPRRRG